MYRERADGCADAPANAQSASGVSGLVEQLEARIAAVCANTPNGSQRLEDAMRCSMLAPGKRARGLLAMMVTESWGRRPGLALDVAVAIEMIHAASLILDDLPAMDNTMVRRGKPACHVKFGDSTAILAAVALMSAAFSVVANDSRLSQGTRAVLIDVLSRAIGPEGMTGGQEADLNPESAEPGVQDLERMYAAKTGALFEAAALAGTIVADIDGPRRALMADFGMRLGLGFQALDDLADAAEDTSSLVKLLGAGPARQRAEGHITVARECLEASGADTVRLVRYVDSLVEVMVEKSVRGA